MSKHTPGPWQVAPTNSGTFIRYSGERQGLAGYLVEVRDLRSPGETKANAALIAAAPDLLESLRYAIAQVPELATVPGIAAAIAKAAA